MPRIKQTTVYQYAELSDDAKECARDWYRRSGAFDDNWWAESVREDFAEVLKACGFELDKRRGTRTELALYWDTNPISGAFEGSWNANRVNVAPLIADRPVAYTDAEGKQQTCEGNARLVPILERVAALAKHAPYSHGNVGLIGRNISMDAGWSNDDENAETNPDDVEEFAEIVRELGAYFGRSVSDELDYQTSDEAIAESIEANEYEFTEEGKRA